MLGGGGRGEAEPRMLGRAGKCRTTAGRAALPREDRDRVEHGVAGAVINSALHAGSSRRRRHGASRRAVKPCSAAQMEERSRPVGGNIMIVMFSEGQARGLQS